MRGKDAFEQGLRAVLASHTLQSQANVEEVRVSGSLAYTWTTLEVRMAPRAGGDANVRTGCTLSIWRKAADGRWLMMRDANLLAAGK